MFDEYKRFDVDKFLGEYKDNKVKLEELKGMYNSIADSMSQSTDPKVQGGAISSQVEKRAERRAKLEKDIDYLERYFDTVEGLLDTLSPAERIIVREYFIYGKKGERDVELLGIKLFMSQATCYRRIRIIRDKVRDYMRD